MPSESTPPPSSPGQTIILERKERVGFLRRFLVPLLLFALLFMFLGTLLAPSAALPTRLGERYVAGDLKAPKVAIVEVSGTIDEDLVEHVLAQVRQARSDDQVRAVVLRIDSPGGTVSGADRIWREVMILRREKPVVASMGGMAASGGYYVAAPANYVIAEPTCMTGSIGVLMEIPQIGGLLDKVGVKFEVLKTGAWKDSPSLFAPLSPEERERWKVVIDDAFQRFLRVIAQGRGLPLEKVRDAADGRVFTTDEALKYRLIDAEGYLDDAIRKAWNLARVESTKVIRYSRPFRLTDALMGMTARSEAWTADPITLLRSQTPRLLYLAR